MSFSLSREQERVMELFRSGENVFLTGPGGSGKSALIKQMYLDYISSSKKQQKDFPTICVCAMTGCAAILLGCGARTVHSFSGIGLGKGSLQEIVDRVKKNSKKAQRWRQTRVLIVDEVSMMSKHLLETLDYVARRLRFCDRPFGGMQVIFCGDFYQICPVGTRDQPDTMAFCFESPLWFQLFPPANHVLLTKIFRQQEDDTYVDILNEIRVGELSTHSLQKLQQCVQKKPPPSPTSSLSPPIPKLFAVRRYATHVNQQHLDALETPAETFPMKHIVPVSSSSSSSFDIQSEIQYLSNATLAENVLTLKKGARVMSIINIETPDGRFICNGSPGTVLGFVMSESGTFPLVRFDNHIEKTMEPFRWESDTIPGVAIEQIPLILAWALTIHKSQGCTLESAEMNLGDTVFEYGQTYVALSRVKSLDGLYLTEFQPSSILVNPKVKNFIRQLEFHSS